jgi:hypothetical protein
MTTIRSISILFTFVILSACSHAQQTSAEHKEGSCPMHAAGDGKEHSCAHHEKGDCKDGSCPMHTKTDCDDGSCPMQGSKKSKGKS